MDKPLLILIFPFPKSEKLQLTDVPECAREYENAFDCWALIRFADDKRPVKTFLWRDGEEFHVIRE